MQIMDGFLKLIDADKRLWLLCFFTAYSTTAAIYTTAIFVKIVKDIVDIIYVISTVIGQVVELCLPYVVGA